MMRLEKSCGAVVYTMVQGCPYFLIQLMQQGHYSLPKGHVENDETERQTARREIFEETGLNVVIHRHFREVISYSPRTNVQKEVVFFLARATSMQTTPQVSEVQSLHWLPFDTALTQLTYASDQYILQLALGALPK